MIFVYFTFHVYDLMTKNINFYFLGMDKQDLLELNELD